MTTKRTRPDRRKAMTGKPPLNPKGRPAQEIKVWHDEVSGNIVQIQVGNEYITCSSQELYKRIEKDLMRNRKKPSKI